MIGILQRFEFTFELAWKTLKEYLVHAGFDVKSGSPRDVLQIAFKENIIKDGDTWIKMMISRNEISHQYDYDISRKIYIDIKEKYVPLLEELNKIK